MTKITAAFDIDGTLIHQGVMSEDTPRYDVIQLFKLFESFGCEMYIWSGCGIDYADRWREKLGLDAHVVAKKSFIPDIAVDDFPQDDLWHKSPLGKVNLKV